MRADQTIIMPLSGDPFGSPFEFEFADEVIPLLSYYTQVRKADTPVLLPLFQTRTADSISTLHITLRNATYFAVIADQLAFSSTSPDRASALLTVPHEFIPGLYGKLS